MTQLPAACEGIVRRGLVALVAFTPLAFGTVEPWSIAVMEWGVVTLCLVFGLGRLWPERGAATERAPLATGLEWPLGLFLIFCVLQTVPLPGRWLSAVSPGSAGLYGAVERSLLGQQSEMESALARSEGPIEPALARQARPVSVHPRATLERLRLLGILIAVFYLVAAWARDEEKIVHLFGAVTIMGFIVAIEGLVQYLTWNGKIYWFRKIPSTGAFGPFVNHNHFAGYAEMVIPVAIGMALYLAAGERAVMGRGGDGRWGKGALCLFAAVILVASLFLSLSRGGIASSLLSGAFLMLLLWPRIPSRPQRWALAVALPALAAGFVLWIGADVVRQQLATVRRPESEPSFQLRARIWGALVRNISPYLWVGSGLGTFEDSFAPFTPPVSTKRWDRAHNDYLQALWETGIVGVALILAGVGRFVARYWWPSLQVRGHPLDFFRLAVGAALLSMALHSIVDFNLQIGSNGFLFALLAGLLVALQRMTGAERSDRPVLVRADAEP